MNGRSSSSLTSSLISFTSASAVTSAHRRGSPTIPRMSSAVRFSKRSSPLIRVSKTTKSESGQDDLSYLAATETACS